MPSREHIQELLRHALLLAALSALLSVIAWAVHPARIPWVGDWAHHVETLALREGIPLVNTPEMRRIAAAGTHLILDARPLADFDAGHIPGAVPLPYDNLDAHYEQARLLMSPEMPVVAYCSGGSCDDSFLLCLHLRKQGFTNVILYAEGWTAWEASP
ncbi:MAG TPA: rhodanese-like domain-containing protein [Kiritimatiellia bacterium]|nr:rhodanese-like domain-containing protein [Kiritimatiellia bacterium]HQQ04673.1 rhodanese-like domain-containing protein [Kiritimatiellia bacterium]